MRTKAIFRNLFFILAVSVLIASCTYTTSSTLSTKESDFKEETAVVSKKIKAIENCEDIIYQTERQNTNGIKSSRLTVKLINPKNIPATTDNSGEVAIQIAKVLKQEVKDTSAFDAYTLVFEYHAQSGSSTHDYKATYNYKKEAL